MRQGHRSVCPYHFRSLAGELVRPFIARGAGVTFHPDQVYRPLPGGSAQGRHPPLDADRVFLARSGSGVSDSCDGTCRVRVDHEGAARIAIV
jgi:hypothetical protein